MPSMTSTMRTRPSERRTRRRAVAVPNHPTRPRSSRLLAVIDHPLGGRHIAVVATRRAPFLRYLTIIPGGGRPSPGDGPSTPAPALRHAA